MNPILVLGGGGHAKVLIATLLAQGREFVGYLDKDPAIGDLLGVKHLGDVNAEAFNAFEPNEVLLINGFGSVGDNTLRVSQFKKWKARGFAFQTVVDFRATMAGYVQIGEGAQVMAGAVVQTGCVIGENSILNTGALLDHDCSIGRHVHVATGASLSGNVVVGEGAHIGTGAAIIQGIRIGENSIVGAGSVVVRDVPPRSTVMGVPAHRKQ